MAEPEEPTLIERLRKLHAEITDSDGGESPMMAMVREAADELADWDVAFEMFWRANKRATDLYMAAHPDADYHLPDQGKMIDWLCDTIMGMRERLEVTHYWKLIDGEMTRVDCQPGDVPYDGIACRDETIRLLQAALDLKED